MGEIHRVNIIIAVVFFDQVLGAALTKHCSKNVSFYAVKLKKGKKHQNWCKFWQKYVFLFLRQNAGWKFYSYKTCFHLKKHISTSIWSAQHPNACQNIKQIAISSLFLTPFPLKTSTKWENCDSTTWWISALKFLCSFW